MNASVHPQKKTRPCASYLWVVLQVADEEGSGLQDIRSMGGVMVAVLTMVVGLHHLYKSDTGLERQVVKAFQDSISNASY